MSSFVGVIQAAVPQPFLAVHLCTHSFPVSKELFFLSRKEIVRPVSTNWGDISLVKAIQRLLNESLKDEENKVFCLISDSHF